MEDRSHVIAPGRQKEDLEELVHKYGHDKVSAVQFDITNLNDIPDFATTVAMTHPDLAGGAPTSPNQKPSTWTWSAKNSPPTTSPTWP